MPDDLPPGLSAVISLWMIKANEVSIEYRVMRDLICLVLSETARREADPHRYALHLTETLRVALHKTWPEHEAKDHERWQIMEQLTDEIFERIVYFLDAPTAPSQPTSL